jgi:hypothetical protein
MMERDRPTSRIMRSEHDLDAVLRLHGNGELDAIVEREDKIRFEQLRKDVANRLKKACGHLNDAEFEQLVDKITGVQLRGERRGH